MSIEHLKRTNQKRVEKRYFELRRTKCNNFVQRTLKQHRKESINLNLGLHRMIVKKNQSEESFGPSETNIEIKKIEKTFSTENKDFG